MATDYDEPRRTESSDDASEDSLAGLASRGNTAVIDVDETDTAESYELPGADLSGEEFSVRIVPKQRDEFTCVSCFLVHHRSRLANSSGTQMICQDCAG